MRHAVGNTIGANPTMEELRRENERLRGRVAQLENQLSSAQQECQRLRGEVNQVTHTEHELIDRLKAENQELDARLSLADHDDLALRIIIKHLAEIL